MRQTRIDAIQRAGWMLLAAVGMGFWQGFGASLFLVSILWYADCIICDVVKNFRYKEEPQ